MTGFFAWFKNGVPRRNEEDPVAAECQKRIKTVEKQIAQKNVELDEVKDQLRRTPSADQDPLLNRAWKILDEIGDLTLVLLKAHNELLAHSAERLRKVAGETHDIIHDRLRRNSDALAAELRK